MSGTFLTPFHFPATSYDAWHTVPRQEKKAQMKQHREFRIVWAACLLILVLVELAAAAAADRPSRVRGTSGELGVVLWNTTEKPAGFEVTVPEAELVSAAEPERDQVKAFSELAAQTVRLVVWKTK